MICISEGMMKTSQTSAAQKQCSAHLRSKHQTYFMRFTKQ